MVINSGVNKVIPDHRDFSHTGTFGALSPETFPESCDTDNGVSNPDQNADGRSNSCRAYTQSEICYDEDKSPYKVSYTDEKQCLIEGISVGSPGDIRASLKSTLVYGVQAPTEKSDMEAFQHRRGSYYQIEQAPDFFDGIRSVLAKGLSVSMASPWYENFNLPDDYGIVNKPFPGYKYSMHNFKICGWVTIAGIPYLKIKPWIGPQFGVNGFCYFSREVVNFLLDQTFTGAFVLDRFEPKTKSVVLYTTWEVLLGYCYRILSMLKLGQ